MNNFFYYISLISVLIWELLDIHAAIFLLDSYFCRLLICLIETIND